MVKFFSSLSLMFLAFATFAQNALNLNQGSIAQKHYFQKIPYQKIKGKIVVSVMINGKTYTFFWDSGAPFSISEKLYKELNPPSIGKVPVADASGVKQEMKIISLPSLQLGEVSFINTSGLVLDASAAKLLDCFGVDGFIGSNMLRNSVLQFDDAHHQIIITDKAKGLSLKKIPYQKMELSEKQSNPFIKIVLQKEEHSAADKLLFDSGADWFYEMSLGAYNWFNGRIDVVNKMAESEGSFSWGMHGMAPEQHQYLLNAPKLVVNKTTFSNVVITTTSSAESRIGSKLLQFGKVTLDYKNKRFYFEPYENIKADELSEKPFAIFPTFKNDKLVVGVIWNNALKNKINLGDELLNFNGVDYQSMSFCDIAKWEHKWTDEKAVVELKDIKTGQRKKIEVGRIGFANAGTKNP